MCQGSLCWVLTQEGIYNPKLPTDRMNVRGCVWKREGERDPPAYKMRYHGAHNHSNLQAICCVAMGTVIPLERVREKERKRHGERGSIFCTYSETHDAAETHLSVTINTKRSILDMTATQIYRIQHFSDIRKLIFRFIIHPFKSTTVQGSINYLISHSRVSSHISFWTWHNISWLDTVPFHDTCQGC